MKKIFCTKCESWTSDKKEIAAMENGDLNNRCPVCGEFDCLILIDNNNNNN